MQPALPFYYAAHQLQADRRRREAGLLVARARRRRLPVLRRLFRPIDLRLPAPQRAPVTARHRAAPGS
jgi:hypothetical protein